MIHPTGSGFRVLVIGFYGAPNIGDEVLLDIVVRHIRSLGGELIVASVDPAQTERMHSVDAIALDDIGAIARALLQCDALIMGGGGIFQDHHPFNLEAVYVPSTNDIAGYARPMLLARQMGIPVYIWGHGVGPLRSAPAQTLVRELFEHAEAVSVRDRESRDLLHAVGVGRDIVVAADPGWQFRRFHPLPEVPHEHAPPTLAVVVREWGKGNWKSSLAVALRDAVPANWRIHWVAFQAGSDRNGALSDLPLIEELRALVGDREGNKVVVPTDVEEAWAVLARADAVLSMRLHASILALLAGRPTAGLEYDPKLSHAHEMAQMPDVLRLQVSDDSERFSEALRALLSRAWVPDPACVDELERSAQAHLEMLQSLASLSAPSLRFDAQGFDWLSVWLQQTLTELREFREQSRKAHELLNYRDFQLAEKDSALSALNTRLEEAHRLLQTDMDQIATLQERVDHADDALAQALRQGEEALRGVEEALSISRRNAETEIQLRDEKIEAINCVLEQSRLSIDVAVLESNRLREELDGLARTLEAKDAYIEDKEVYIALLRRQVEELDAALQHSRQETEEARNLWRRLHRFLGLLRRDVVRIAAAPFKLAAVWRRYGARVALQQIPRRMKTLGVLPTAPIAEEQSAEGVLVRPVRRERLLVLASALSDESGWPSRCLQLAKAADRAGFMVRVHIPSQVSAGINAGPLVERLVVDADSWLQSLRADATRVLLADASPRAVELAASARSRGATVIVDLSSLSPGFTSLPNWHDIAALADRLVSDDHDVVVPGFKVEYLAEAGDNEIFDSYRSFERPPGFGGAHGDVLVVMLGSASMDWLSFAAQEREAPLFHVVGEITPLPSHPRIKPQTWSWAPEEMAPLLAAARSVVVLGGGEGAAVSELRRRVVMAALLLEKPVHVDVDPGPGLLNSPNLHVGVAELTLDVLLRTQSVEDYRFVASSTWLGRAEQLIGPAYPESVSVVVLIHNNRRIIERCVSTLLQHAGDWLQEIVVVDNQSSDGGAELVEQLYGRHPKVVFVRNSENGCSSGRNLGVRHSTGKYIAFFDSDQWLTSASCFAEAVAVLGLDEGIGTIGWNAGWFDASRDDLGGPISDYLPHRGMNAEARIKGYRNDVGFLGTSCMFIARELFDQLEGFDTFYDPTCFEDTDICFQVKNAGYSVAFRDFAGVRHQPHQTTGASEGSERYRQLFNRNADYFRKKWQGRPEFFVDLKSWH
ncbi:polysaccharide pyruvyl transferase family protein [Pseudoxanthomonas winnipegensis]|uniref:polysaccharide pyruvyl transferase family protein n=1 Tax=Pseudoxanthomonas winnipegensis TaxID=2480810 RepID=UPI003F86831B